MGDQVGCDETGEAMKSFLCVFFATKVSLCTFVAFLICLIRKKKETMRRIFVFFLAGLTSLASCMAQDDVYLVKKSARESLAPQVADGGVLDVPLTSGGGYEKVEVVAVEGASAGVLFGRAMEALSDWTGPDGKAKAGVDYQDKETGTVIYKGRYSLGFKNVFLGDGWRRYSDFTLKVRCKDGKAQVTVTVPTMTGVYNRNGLTRDWTVAELVAQVKKTKGDKRERGLVLVSDLVENADGLVSAMCERLKVAADDDF